MRYRIPMIFEVEASDQTTAENELMRLLLLIPLAEWKKVVKTCYPDDAKIKAV